MNKLHDNSDASNNNNRNNNNGAMNITKFSSNSKLNSISDAMQQIESLKFELERAQMGLHLMQLSVNKLVDIIATPANCCTSMFDIITMQTTIAGASEHFSFSSSTPSNIRSSSHSNIGDNNGIGRSGSPSTKFTLTGNKGLKMGYENVSTHTNDEMLSIDQNEDL